MPKLIGFGKCSRYYQYILYTVILRVIRNVIYGFSDIDQRNKEFVQVINPEPLFCQHNLLQNLFRYLGGYIIWKIKYKKKSAKQQQGISESKNEENIFQEIELIHIDYEKYKKFINFDMIIIGIIFCVHYELRKLFYLMKFHSMDIWTFNILFIVMFMYFYFQMEFYNFQKCSLFFIAFTNTILLIINTFLRQLFHDNINEYQLYEKTTGNAAYCVPFLFTFIILSIIISYARVKVKVITTYKFISNNSIIIVMGFCGLFLTIIEIVLSETLKCNPEKMKEAFKSICLVNNTNNESFHDDLKTFAVKFGNLSGKDILINILLIIFYPIISFFEIFCEILIIYYLNPIYILARDNIYNFSLSFLFVLFKINNNPLSYTII